ncbi:hypothetical protein V6N13_122088 [Hibiscus sabdariffa]
MAVVDVSQREVGEISGRKFARRLAASQVTHVSGSVDKQVMLWTGKLGFPSLLPSQVMSISGSPHLIYTCGEDGLVQHLQNFLDANQLVVAGCGTRLNPNVFAVVGSDHYTRLYDIHKYKCDGATDFSRPIDYFYPPPHVIVNTNDTFRKTCLAFSDQSELLVSYRDNSIYLFTHDMGPRNNPVPSSPSSSSIEANGKAIPQVYKGHGKKERVDSLSFFGPKSKFVVSGSGNG